jgi:hypothetical protein
LTFFHIIGKRLLSIYIFACFERQLGYLSMPVIWSSNCYSVDVFAFEDVPEVAVCIKLKVRLQTGQRLGSAGKVFLVQITERSDLYVRKRGEPVHMTVAHTTKTDVRYPHLVGGASQQVGDEGNAKAGEGASLDELSATEGHAYGYEMMG